MSSDSDDLEDFFASLRAKKKDTFRLSSGSMEEFLVDNEHVSFEEKNSSSGSGEDLERNLDESDLKEIEEAVSILQLSSIESSLGSEVESKNISDKDEESTGDGSRNHSPIVESRYFSKTKLEDDVGKDSLGEATNTNFIKQPFKVSTEKKAKMKNLDTLRRRGSFTPKRSTASSSSASAKKSISTPKIIFSSSESEEDTIFSKDIVRNLNLGKDSVGTISSREDQVKKKLKKSSRILLPSDSDEDSESNTKKESVSVANDSDGHITSEPTDNIPKETQSPTNYRKDLDSRALNLDSGAGCASNTFSKPSNQTKTQNLLSNSPSFVFPKISRGVSSSAKKSSRILVLSDDDSDSDLDNDVIYIYDDDDKENLDNNVIESPNGLNSVFTSSKNFKKKHPGFRDFDENEEYTPLASRILGGNLTSRKDDPIHSRRKISEPGTCKPISTPSSKPPKTCFSERPLKTKTVTGSVKSNGIPTNLASNSNKGPAFRRQRDFLTKTLYDYFNETIFKEKLPKTMIVEWDKRLTKTAGVTKCSTRTVTTIEHGIKCVTKTYKATISLSEKVLDTLERLRDTLCHEMCHAAVWLLDNQSDGHGPFWKAWARQATTAHPLMPIIKRCHSYDITYKFQYQCIVCRKIYGRHSKSIKVDKQACGVCRGKLVLLPTKNSDGTPAKPRQANKFAMFVKDNYKSTQQAKTFAGVTPKHSDVMKALSEQFGSLSTKI